MKESPSPDEGRQVYVNHVAGKLQVRFCGLQMSGSSGTSNIPQLLVTSLNVAEFVN